MDRLLKRLIARGAFDWMPDPLYLRLLFRLRLGYRLNLSSPRSFNEKIQWLKLYDRRPEYRQYVDKYAVRDHIRKVVGEEYLIPLLGVWDSVEDIDFALLPNQFVLKTTHDSGGVVICRDKSVFDISAAKQKLNRHMKNDFFNFGREWAYKGIKPRVIAEQLLQHNYGGLPEDFKLMCFNGTVRCSFVCSDRGSNSGLKVTFYDREWKKLPFIRHYPESPVAIAKPYRYDLMIELSERLARDMPFCRVDCYEVDGKVYIGEMTLYPGCGFEEFDPQQWDNNIGSWLVLPKRVHE